MRAGLREGGSLVFLEIPAFAGMTLWAMLGKGVGSPIQRANLATKCNARCIYIGDGYGTELGRWAAFRPILRACVLGTGGRR